MFGGFRTFGARSWASSVRGAPCGVPPPECSRRAACHDVPKHEVARTAFDVVVREHSRSCDKRFGLMILTCLGHCDAVLRCRALEMLPSLAERGCQETLGILWQFMQDGQTEVQLTLIEALLQLASLDAAAGIRAVAVHLRHQDSPRLGPATQPLSDMLPAPGLAEKDVGPQIDPAWAQIALASPPTEPKPTKDRPQIDRTRPPRRQPKPTHVSSTPNQRRVDPDRSQIDRFAPLPIWPHAHLAWYPI